MLCIHYCPFGCLDTPDANTTVSGSIAVTGWALDDIGIDSIAIYRNDSANPNKMVYIGHAVIVEGARSDIASLFPSALRWMQGKASFTGFRDRLSPGTSTWSSLIPQDRISLKKSGLQL